MTYRQPAEDRLWNWLQSKDVVRTDGGVNSWANSNHPGFRYPEAGGLLLSLLTIAKNVNKHLCQRILGGLIDDVMPNGSIRKDERSYLFDTAIVLSAFLAYEFQMEELLDSDLLQQLFKFIREKILLEVAADPLIINAEKWSLSYGCHLLKCAIALLTYYNREQIPQSIELARKLLHDLIPLCVSGRFHIHAKSSETYVHAHCYAVEGLITVTRHGILEMDVEQKIWDSAHWLGQIQESNGGIRAWHNGKHGYGDFHADCIAQAIRIWLQVDATRFKNEIARGFHFLSGLQSPEGGIRYSSDSQDINTCASIFTAQALLWMNNPKLKGLFI